MKRYPPLPVTLTAVLGLALVGCGPSTAQPPAGAPATLVTGLETPWSVVCLGNTAGQRTRRGTHRGAHQRPPDPPNRHGRRCPARGESGLLGLALDGQRRLYAYSTGPDGNRIQRFDLTGQPGSLGLGPAETIIDGLPSASYHDGGRIAFGPDGMLYATVGDAGRRDDAQDLDSLGGKILRMTPDGDVPADNPFPGTLVYSYGHRNPQGLAWAADGTMFASEFGQNTWDELNIITPGGNYGWPYFEGIGGDDRYLDPVQQSSPAQASPSGMTIVGGTIFIANLRGQVLRAVPVADPPRPPTTTPVSTGASATPRGPRTATCGSSPATQTPTANPVPTTTACSASRCPAKHDDAVSAR
jgi:glucose/arabinose dehydrogenase